MRERRSRNRVPERHADDQGFLHCCLPGQLDGVVAHDFRGRTGPVAPRIVPEKLKPPLRWVGTPGSDETFRHVRPRRMGDPLERSLVEQRLLPLGQCALEELCVEGELHLIDRILGGIAPADHERQRPVAHLDFIHVNREGDERGTLADVPTRGILALKEVEGLALRPVEFRELAHLTERQPALRNAAVQRVPCLREMAVARAEASVTPGHSGGSGGPPRPQPDPNPPCRHGNRSRTAWRSGHRIRRLRRTAAPCPTRPVT
jgi:hypothetical protein